MAVLPRGIVVEPSPKLVCADALVAMLANIAVVAENLKSGRIAFLPKPHINGNAGMPALAAVDFIAMLGPVFIDVVDGEHRVFCLTAAFAEWTAVGVECRHLGPFLPFASLGSRLFEVAIPMLTPVFPVLVALGFTEPLHLLCMALARAFSACVRAIPLSPLRLSVDDRKFLIRPNEAAFPTNPLDFSAWLLIVCHAVIIQTV